MLFFLSVAVSAFAITRAQLEAMAIFPTQMENEDIQAPQVCGVAEIITFQIGQQ